MPTYLGVGMTVPRLCSMSSLEDTFEVLAPIIEAFEVSGDAYVISVLSGGGSLTIPNISPATSPTDLLEATKSCGES